MHKELLCWAIPKSNFNSKALIKTLKSTKSEFPFSFCEHPTLLRCIYLVRIWFHTSYYNTMKDDNGIDMQLSLDILFGVHISDMDLYP